MSSIPPYVATTGAEAVELAALAGLHLDPWQAYSLEVSLGERADGKWSAFEVGLIVARQNGKGSILEARELAGLFLLGERQILHSAHEFKTALEGFLRIEALITNCDALRKRVRKVTRSHGEEGIELLTGQRLKFVARSKGSGRGFTADCIILDEAYHLDAEKMAALLPTLSSRPNPQLWYTSSAGMAESTQLAAVRARGLRGGDPGLAYLEWSADPALALDDPVGWRQANPAYGRRIPREFIERERAAMPDKEFARERLSIWPDAGSDAPINPATWASLATPASELLDPVCFAVDSPPDRSYTSICVAGVRDDGEPHVEVVEHRPGVSWAAQRLLELHESWDPCGVVIDAGSGAGSLIPELEAAGIEVLQPSVRDIAAASGIFYDAVVDEALHHIDQAPLNAAVAAARQRPLSDAWAWSRKGLVVIAPLVGCSLALWGWQIKGATATDISLNIW